MFLHVVVVVYHCSHKSRGCKDIYCRIVDHRQKLCLCYCNLVVVVIHDDVDDEVLSVDVFETVYEFCGDCDFYYEILLLLQKVEKTCCCFLDRVINSCYKSEMKYV